MMNPERIHQQVQAGVELCQSSNWWQHYLKMTTHNHRMITTQKIEILRLDFQRI